MTNALMLRGQTLPVPVGNLESYIHAIHAIPVLDTEEERTWLTVLNTQVIWKQRVN